MRLVIEDDQGEELDTIHFTVDETAAETRLRETLNLIRGVCLNREPRDAVTLINRIVGEALYGDFRGTIAKARREVPG